MSSSFFKIDLDKMHKKCVKNSSNIEKIAFWAWKIACKHLRKRENMVN